MKWPEIQRGLMVSQNLTLLARACFDRGVAHVQKREWDKAVAALTDALRHDPDHPKAHYYRGRAHAARQDFPAAITDFNASITREVSPPEARRARGRSGSPGFGLIRNSTRPRTAARPRSVAEGSPAGLFPAQHVNPKHEPRRSA